MRTIKEIRKSVVTITDDFKIGDYVFACKYPDAGPRDRWAVDIIKDVSMNIGNGRAGVFFEESGGIAFKYAVKITADEGKKILRYWLKRYNKRSNYTLTGVPITAFMAIAKS